MHLKSKSSIGK